MSFSGAGITEGATEHSPRRGGLGFRYYVLGEHPDYIRDTVGHTDMQETLTYIGFFDKENSNVLHVQPDLFANSILSLMFIIAAEFGEFERMWGSGRLQKGASMKVA